ncbi:hypothetical protein C0993_009366 [Termitomyces sp. T159_Od127]|nr:hypothetical protein C0993_009366 [Termitomyces sp. T159_Od127]
MYHRHHAWQHHHLYPTEPWPDYPDPQDPPPPPPPPAPYTHDLLAPRLALAGSLDPATGIFYRSPEHPRLRTAQACEKCRTRKAKCSGEHPTCKRCSTRGLVCEYAKEGRVRGPNKPKAKQHAESSKKPGETSAGSSNAEMGDMLLAPRELQQRRPVRPRPQQLRLDQTATQPHTPQSPAPFPALYPAADCEPSPSGRRSCSLSESGGSVYVSLFYFTRTPSPRPSPSSAVSSTFDLSPPQPPAPRYPPGTHIHQLTHEQQHRLLSSTAAAVERHLDLDLDLPTAHYDPHAHIAPLEQHHAPMQAQYHPIKQEHDPRFVVEPPFPVLHAQHPQQQQYIPELEYPAWAGFDPGRAYPSVPGAHHAHGYIHHQAEEFRS